MTRPRKHNVIYFPHYCKHGKVLFILESKYGNDGYAFFYKLLEALGDAEGHFIDCSKPDHMEYIAAVTGARNPVSATEMLNTLSNLSIIDPELWSNGIIWMQSFVDSLDMFYRKRSFSAPVKPVSAPKTPVSGVGNPEVGGYRDKDKDKKRKERKEKITFTLPEWIKKETWDAYVEMRLRKRAAPTERAKELIVKELDKLRMQGQSPNEVLNQSIMKSWTGVFPLKEGGNGKRPGTYRTDIRGHEVQDEAERINAEYYARKAAKEAARSNPPGKADENDVPHFPSGST